MTDDFAYFLFRCRRQPWRNRCRLIEKLYIEYQSEDKTIPYPLLLEHGLSGWSTVGHTSDREQARKLNDCAAQLAGITHELEKTVEQDTRVIFPRLRVVAVSSIYGHSNLWAEYEEKDRDAGGDPDPHLIDCLQHWGRFMATSDITHWCLRQTRGPVSILPISRRALTGQYRPQFNVHFCSEPDLLALRIGHFTRWISDIPVTSDWHPIYENVMASLARLVEIRTERFLESKKDTINIEVCLSTDSIGRRGRPYRPDRSSLVPRLEDVAASTPGGDAARLTVATQRAIAEKIGTTCQTTLRRYSRLKDEIRFLASVDTPVCEACGSGPPA